MTRAFSDFLHRPGYDVMLFGPGLILATRVACDLFTRVKCDRSCDFVARVSCDRSCDLHCSH